MSQQSNKIKVVCRVRPFLPTEKPDKTVTVDGKKSLLIANLRDSTKQVKFNFDACYPSTSRQSTIFKNDVQPLLDTIFDGMSSTVFCYGVTGAGKTHTIQGTDTNPGIIPRALQYIFEKQQDQKIKISYFEIYKESVFDLLKPAKDTSGLPIREDAHRRIFVAGLSERPVQSYEQFDQIYRKASSNRKTASTKLNNHSSRSHAILTVQVLTNNLVGRLHLIDLAGSEDNRRTDNQRDRLVESSAINRSLFVLGQVVEALNSGASRIPYRDSKMTRILQDSLGGSSLGMMIVNVAPGQSFLQDTHNTLNFATKSREVVNKPVVNEVEKWSVVDRWQHQRSGVKAKRKRAEQEEEPKKRYSDGIVEKTVTKRPAINKRSSAPPPETSESKEIIERVTRIEQQLSGSQLDSTKVIDMFTPATKLKTSRGWLRHAKDLEMQGELERALVHYEEALKYAPGLDRLGAHIEKLRQRVRKEKRRSSIKSHGAANMLVEDKMEMEVEVETLGLRQVAGRPINKKPKPLFAEKAGSKRAVVKLSGCQRATKGSVHDLRRISFGTSAMNPFVVDGRDFDSDLQNQMEETKPMRTDKLLAKSSVAARLQKKLAEPRTPGDDKEYVLEESDVSEEEEEPVPRKKRRLPGSLSVRGLVEQRRKMEEPKKASPVTEEKLVLDDFNEITLASVLQMINSGEVKKIMKLQGVGKRRAEQIQKSVQEMGPLRRVDELQSRLQFKNKLIKGILSTFA